MLLSVKNIWLASSVLLFIAVLCFLIGTIIVDAASEISGLKIVVVIFPFLWIPAMIILIISIISIKREFLDKATPMIALTLIFACILLYFINPVTIVSRLLNDYVVRDWSQVTLDGIFEYRVEVVNRHQLINNRTQLSVKNLLTEEEMFIPLPVSRGEVRITGGESSITPVPEDASSFAMSELVSTEVENIYILTTRRFSILVFEINMEARTARRIE